MSYSRRQLYAMLEPFGESATRIEGGRRIYGGGDSGQNAATIQSIPDELKPLARAYTDKAIGMSQQGFRPYTGDRYSDLNQTQNLGIGMVQDRALQGSQTMRNAETGLNQLIQDTPYGATQNLYGNVSAQANPYGGDNPYLDAMVKKAQGSVVDRFNTMTKPQTEAAMQQSGSFGNSGYQQLMQSQQKAAAQQMGDISTQMYGQEYGNRQQLAEAGVARNLQAQQFNAGMGQDLASRSDAVRQQQVGNRMQAIGIAPTFGAEAYKDASQLMNVGQTQQDQGQRNLDFGYQQFQDAENLPYKQLAGMSGVFGSNLGSSSKTTSTGGGK